MSQALISAAEKSVTLSKMTSLNKYVPFYQPSPSMDAIGVLFSKVNPSIPLTGPIENNSVSWNLPSSGFMVDMSFEFPCVMPTVAGAALTQQVAFDMVRSFEIISNGVPIINKTGVALKAQAQSLRDPGHQTFILTNATFLDATTEEPTVPTNAVKWLTYLPCIETFLSAPEKFLLLNKTKLEVRITFNSTILTGVDSNITFDGSPVMHIKSYMPKMSLYNEIVQNDYSKQFSMDTVNCYTEQVPLTTVTTVSNYAITCPYLAIKTHFIVRRINTTTVKGSPTYKINTIDLNLGGVKFLDRMKTSRVISNDCKFGMNKFNVGAGGAITYKNDTLTIDWGILGSRDGAHGVNFWAENQGSVVSLDFSTVTQVLEANLFVVHEYLQLVDYVPGSGGRGMLQVSSNN